MRRNRPQVQLNKPRVQAHIGAAFMLNRNLEEVRHKNLLNKQAIIRKPLIKKV